MLPVKNILCPTDFSQSSIQSTDTVNKLAELFGSTVYLVNVVVPVPINEGYPGMIDTSSLNTEQLDMEIHNNAKESLKKMAAEHFSDAIEVKRTVLTGSPVDEITRFAKEQTIDLIIVPTHGRTGLRRLVMGSVAEGIIRHASCPVLVTRAEKE